MEELQEIICLSDLHLGGDHGEDAEADALAGALIEELDPATSLVVVCGDIIQTPTDDLIASAARWCDRLEDAGLRVLTVPGNHDMAKGGWQGVDETLRARFVLGVVTARPLCMGDVLDPPWHADVAHVRVILIDSQWALRGWGRRPDFARGKIGGAQLAEVERLHDEAREAGMLTVWILHHRPGYDTHLIDGDNALADQAALAALAAQLRPDAVVCGHQHPPPGMTLDLEGVGAALVCPKATARHEGALCGWRLEVAAGILAASGYATTLPTDQNVNSVSIEFG